MKTLLNRVLVALLVLSLLLSSSAQLFSTPAKAGVVIGAISASRHKT